MPAPFSHQDGRFSTFTVLLLVTCALLVVFALGMFSPKAPSTSISNSTHHHRNPAVDQVVLVLVDALRPDFALSTLSPQGGDGFSCQSPKEMSLPVYASATLTFGPW
ncbi:membrane-associated protein, putative [Bodo saltans]|uniref:Membrane-associated protein, putative n=1 Tax=Bodo saltans TaxID=75058 RepID=A0A0S4IU34_BODSA|nr:membrane-associated protein, putative [Bodo saltans]|eukprot:CUF88557.1 membrane-associated protein, putative [Bodo saltans]